MTINGNTAMAVGALGIVLLLLCIGAWVAALFRIKDIKRSVLYIAESAILIFVVLLLAWGTRDTVLKVVDSFQRDKVVFSDDRDTAVLEAYDKLSNELNRWSVMFVALGAFFGLVLPIGAYLLQMKEIARKEGAVDEKLKQEQEKRKEEIEKVMSEIEGARRGIQKTMDVMMRTKVEVTESQMRIEGMVRKLWKSQVAMSQENLADIIQDMGDCDWQLDKVHVREFRAALILFLRCLANIDGNVFVLEHLSILADLLKLVTDHVSDEEMEQWVKVIARGKKTVIRLSPSIEGEGERKDAFEEIKAFAKKFGIGIV